MNQAAAVTQRIIAKILVVGGCQFSRDQNCYRETELIEIMEPVTSVPPETREFTVRSNAFSSLLIPRRGAVAIPYRFPSQDRGIVIGGSTGSEHLSTVESVELPTSSSLSHGSGPGPRTGSGPHGTGSGTTGPMTATFRHSNLALNDARSCAMIASLEDDLYVLGGYDGFDCLKSVERVRLNSIIASAPNGNEKANCCHFERCTPDLPCPIKNGYAIANNRKNSCGSILLFGGWDGRRTLSTVFQYSVVSSPGILEASEISLSTSSLHGLLPYPIECHACVKRGNIVWLFGGFDGICVRDTIVAYDCVSGKATAISGQRLAIARECHDCVLTADERYAIVVGGWNGTQALRSVEVFEFVEGNNGIKRVAVLEEALSLPRIRCCALLVD